MSQKQFLTSCQWIPLHFDVAEEKLGKVCDILSQKNTVAERLKLQSISAKSSEALFMMP